MRFGDHLVACFDLLAQSNRLLEVPKKPEREETIQYLKETVGVVLDLRKQFEQYFAAEADVSASFSPREQKLLDDTRLFHWGFSDTYIVAVAFHSDDAVAAVVYAIYRTMCAASLTWLVNLSTGHPLRGGMEIGPATDIGPAEVYGPALVEAHCLEAKIAEYPRIMVGQRCIRFLRRVAQDMPGTGSGKLANTCLQWLRESNDEHAMLDSLSGDFLDRLPTLEETRRTLEAAHDYVDAQLQQAAANKDTKLGPRYKRLKSYLREKAPETTRVFGNRPDQVRSR